MTALTTALSFIPHQLSTPRSVTTTTVTGNTIGAIRGMTSVKYWMPESELIAEVKK